MMRAARLGVVVLGVVAGLSAQTTILVGPGGFPQISAALAVAQPGDRLEVAAGGYAPFTVNLGVQIVATGQVTIVGSGPPFTTFVTNLGAPAGQNLLIRGLTFASSGSTNGHRVAVTGGQVALENCWFEGGHPSKVDEGLRCTGADVVLRRCTFDTAHKCLRLFSGSLAATDCKFLPYEYGISIGAPLHGVEISQGSATFSFCEINGADTNHVPGTGGAAMLVNGGKVRLVDCVVTGGDSSTGLPVPCIVNSSPHAIEHSRSSVVGGFGWIMLGIGALWQRGPGFVGPELQRLLPGTIGLWSGLEGGANFGFTCTADPGRLFVVPMSFTLSPPSLVPLVLDPIRFDPAALVIPFAGVTDAQGQFRSPVIPIPTGLVAASAFFHPLLLDGTTFLAGVPVGGVVR